MKIFDFTVKSSLFHVNDIFNVQFPTLLYFHTVEKSYIVHWIMNYYHFSKFLENILISQVAFANILSLLHIYYIYFMALSYN